MSAGQFNQIEPNSTEEQPLINTNFRAYKFDVIDGVTYQIDVTNSRRYNGDGEIINKDAHRIVNLQYKGEPVDENQEFLVATNNYRAGGGGDFPNLDGSQIVLSPQAENRQIIIDYIKEKGKIDPSVDNNWSIASVEGDAKVVFRSSPDGRAFIDTKEAITYVGESTDGFAKYKIDLSRTSNGKASRDNSTVDGVNSGKEDLSPKKQNENSSNDSGLQTKDSGHKLPETSTNIFNYLLVGLILMAAGFLILIYLRKREASK
ncbi:5'-nucleotidase C-terminal domain-containing protein [Halobacillus shinanisalinarum]|uniref:5'-nucleotidase C-terminal domain-containing protein n=1 Tax=Halobacillus shinanisalinarum TaxID=2932258 RepID=A0ABY4H2Q1_9BACI|nr:5'-nucleotidase C-terminal domain-containing protein [Halobacillus shinanisalinarum]UOQ94738.1 5'-nucleotidase C-terminal domain-containing protein [Halobacillus shinanisalinarum]